MTNDSFSDAAALRPSIQSVLSGGENILLVTKPERIPSKLGGIALVILRLCFIAFVAYIAWTSFSGQGDVLELGGFGWFAIVLPVIILAWGFYQLAKEVRSGLSEAKALYQTVYTITDRRAIVVRKNQNQLEFSTIDINGALKIEYTERYDRSGNIHFGAKLITANGGDTSEIPELSFLYIPDVRSVYETALKVGDVSESAHSGAFDLRAWPLTRGQVARDSRA